THGAGVGGRGPAAALGRGVLEAASDDPAARVGHRDCLPGPPVALEPRDVRPVDPGMPGEEPGLAPGTEHQPGHPAVLYTRRRTAISIMAPRACGSGRARLTAENQPTSARRPASATSVQSSWGYTRRDRCASRYTAERPSSAASRVRRSVKVWLTGSGSCSVENSARTLSPGRCLAQVQRRAGSVHDDT